MVAREAAHRAARSRRAEAAADDRGARRLSGPSPADPEAPAAVFDTHCHLGYDGEDAAAAWQRARAAGVTSIVDVGIDLASSMAARDRARRFAGVRWSAGLHPNDSTRLAAEWDGIEALAREADCVGVGETGLDFFRDRTPPAQQHVAFERHLALARELDKPVIIHCRDAFAATFTVLERQRGVRGVMHCFSGGPDEAARAVALGLYVSFAGPLTYPKSDVLRTAAAAVPADRLLVETDAPFLPPQDRRGQRNEPAWVVRTLERLAELRGWSFTEAAATTTANARALFRVG